MPEANLSKVNRVQNEQYCIENLWLVNRVDNEQCYSSVLQTELVAVKRVHNEQCYNYVLQTELVKSKYCRTSNATVLCYTDRTELIQTNRAQNEQCYAIQTQLIQMNRVQNEKCRRETRWVVERGQNEQYYR